MKIETASRAPQTAEDLTLARVIASILEPMLKLFRSYRFAMILLASLLVSLIAATAVSLELHGSPAIVWFTGLLALLGVNIGVCTIQRLIREIKRSDSPESSATIRGKQFTASTSLPPASLIHICSQLLPIDRNTVSCHEGRWHAVVRRGNVGVWGSILFHLSLIVVIAGIWTSMSLGFRGMFAVTEGERFREAQHSFKNVSAGWLYDTQRIKSLEILLDKFSKAYPVGQSHASASHVSVKYHDDTYDGVVHVNNGLPIDRYTLHQAGQWGFSPGLIVQKPDGGFLVNSFVRLATDRKESHVRWYDSLLIGENLRLFLELFPDFRYKHEKSISGSDNLSNPVLLLKLLKGDSLLAEMLLPVSQEAEVGGLHVLFPEVRFWSQFEIVYDPGLKILYVGFVLIVVGLTIRLLSVRKTIAFVIMENHSGSILILSGSSEKFQHSFEAELRTIYRQIECALHEAESKRVHAMRIHNERVMEPCS